MACCKIYLSLSTLLMCYANANYEYERMKALSHLTDISQSPSNSQYNIYEGAFSEIAPRYYDSYEPNKDRDNFGGLFKRSPIDSVKKESIEKKNLKKMPFYAFTDKDLIKRKKLLADSTKTAHCQEIKVKSFGKDGDLPEGVTTCYKCKDPVTRSTYERCFYKNHPEESASASTKVERFLSVPTSFRYRRSNSEKGKADYKKFKRDPYRFTDKYFTDATYDAPVAYESKEEKCNKIVKNSMVCMVCQDAKTNSKYEQCSYVKQPREEAYSYENKSNSFRDKPQKQRNDSDEYSGSASHSEPSDFAASNRQKDRNSTSTGESSRYYLSEDHPERASTASERDEVQDASQTDCEQIKKDSKICTVCKDPKNGGTYEKCTYNYQPSEKLYKYSRSKSFGYPDKLSHSTKDSNQATQASEESENPDHSQRSDYTDDYLDKIKSSIYPRRSDRVLAETQVASDPESVSQDSSDYSSDYFKGLSDYKLPSNSDGDSKYYGDHAVPSSKSATEQYSETIKEDHCKKVQKDSMTCTICKDPKTGNDFEQCSYSYRPSDKLFAYSKSSSFGNPQKNDESQRVTPHEGDEQSSESLETATTSYDEYTPGQIYEASTTDEAKSEDDVEGKKAVDNGYLDTAKKKAQIEEFMQNFQKQDRSKCKKIMRDKMTCYQCVDEDGFQKEECVFITGRESGDKDQLAFREIKEFQVDPTAHTSQTVPDARTVDVLEPSASASGNSYVRLEKPDNDYPDEKSHAAEETKETEPYDYTSETRPRYDKVLGLTLPAYMFTVSEHEAAFDEVVASSHDQR